MDALQVLRSEGPRIIGKVDPCHERDLPSLLEIAQHKLVDSGVAAILYCLLNGRETDVRRDLHLHVGLNEPSISHASLCFQFPSQIFELHGNTIHAEIAARSQLHSNCWRAAHPAAPRFLSQTT